MYVFFISNSKLNNNVSKGVPSSVSTRQVPSQRTRTQDLPTRKKAVKSLHFGGELKRNFFKHRKELEEACFTSSDEESSTKESSTDEERDTSHEELTIQSAVPKITNYQQFQQIANGKDLGKRKIKKKGTK